ncbi:MAG: hypothetical protein HY044_04080 [Candidatus Woesebacteria bacterium]|nr:MAG: hypothetical protein HY044_04080 [Candidatus Woesebacteria bacterium]
MQSYLLIGDDENQKEKLLKKLNLNPIDFEITKVSDIRSLQKLTSLSTNIKTAFVLKKFEKASIEAQNAFLKSLEEPPKNVFYILLAQKKDNILDTIISRCEVLEIPNKKDYQKDTVEKFTKANVGQKFLILSKIKDRKEAVFFLKNLIQFYHSLFTTEGDKKYLKLIKKGDKVLFAIENQNGNIKIHLASLMV